MNIFARDRLSRADKLLYSLPFKSSDIVLGKYAALLCFFLIEVAALALLPIIIGFFATVSYVSAYLSLICFLLFGAALLAMCMMFAASTKSSITAVLLSYASVIVSFLLYLTPVGATEGAWKTIAGILRFLSPFSHLDEFLIGKFKVTSIIYFALVIALFIILTVKAVNKTRTVNDYGKKSPEAKKFSLSAAFSIILCVCVIAANSLAALVPVRFSTFDMTSSKIMSVGKETKNFISSLDTNVTIHVLDADSSNKSLEVLLANYDAQSDKLTVKYSTTLDVEDILLSLGWDGASPLEPYTLILESDKDRYDVVFPSRMYYYENPQFGAMDENTYSSYLNSLSQYAQQDPTNTEYSSMFSSLINETQMFYNAEELINTSIEYISVDVIPSPYYLTGHGEPGAEDSMLLATYAYLGFPIEVLDAATLTELPADASSLLINAPTEDISKAQAELFIDFLKNGGAMTVITNEANLDMPNLMSVLSAYGLSANKGFVSYDYEAAAKEAAENAEAEATETEEGSATEEETPEYPDKNLVATTINASHEALAPFEGYTTNVLRANEIIVSDSLRDTVKITPALTTNEKCFIDGVENSTGAKVIGVIAEEETSGGTTKLTWLTGAEAYDSENADMMNAYVSLYSVVWGVDAYTSDIEIPEPKLVSQDALSMSTNVRLALVAVVVVVIPAAILIVGAIKLKKYKKARKSEFEN